MTTIKMEGNREESCLSYLDVPNLDNSAWFYNIWEGYILNEAEQKSDWRKFGFAYFD